MHCVSAQLYHIPFSFRSPDKRQISSGLSYYRNTSFIILLPFVVLCHKEAIGLIRTEECVEPQDIRDVMMYITLAPYSPDLNPIKQFWRITSSKMTHNCNFSTKKDPDHILHQTDIKRLTHQMYSQCAGCESHFYINSI